MNPITPTVLSKVARQVKVDSLRRLLSRCALPISMSHGHQRNRIMR